MNLTRWEPRALPRLQREINRIFDNLVGEEYAPDLLPGGGFPSLDISEKDDAYVVTADVPGVKRDDIDISVSDGVVTIKGEKKSEEEKEEAGYQRRERAYGSFTRSFTVPGKVDEEGIKATCKDGVLTLELPKSEEARARQIEVAEG